jgi:hypothetical protein
VVGHVEHESPHRAWTGAPPSSDCAGPGEARTVAAVQHHLGVRVEQARRQRRPDALRRTLLAKVMSAVPT